MAVLVGALIALSTGLIERGGATIPTIQNYGYPWAWRTTNRYGPTTYTSLHLAFNTIFWTPLSLITFISLQIAFQRWNLKGHFTIDRKRLYLFLILFLPLGLAMDLIHEGGHVLWGTLAGGHLTELQIAYFQLYPTFTLTAHFRLGYVHMQGLSTMFAKGLMGIGGSLTTHLAAWLIGVTLIKTQISPKTKLSLYTLGLFGILDLPFYTFLPQLGLRHWIIIGGNYPEPLIAAERLGIPQSIFYLTVILTTSTLILLYNPPLRKKLRKSIHHISN